MVLGIPGGSAPRIFSQPDLWVLNSFLVARVLPSGSASKISLGTLETIWRIQPPAPQKLTRTIFSALPSSRPFRHPTTISLPVHRPARARLPASTYHQAAPPQSPGPSKVGWKIFSNVTAEGTRMFGADMCQNALHECAKAST